MFAIGDCTSNYGLAALWRDAATTLPWMADTHANLQITSGSLCCDLVDGCLQVPHVTSQCLEAILITMVHAVEPCVHIHGQQRVHVVTKLRGQLAGDRRIEGSPCRVEALRAGQACSTATRQASGRNFLHELHVLVGHSSRPQFLEVLPHDDAVVLGAIGMDHCTSRPGTQKIFQ